MAGLFTLKNLESEQQISVCSGQWCGTMSYTEATKFANQILRYTGGQVSQSKASGGGSTGRRNMAGKTKVGKTRTAARTS